MTISTLLLLFPFCYLYLFTDNSQSYKLSDLRQEYVEASKDEEAGERFYKKMRSYKKDDPVVMAYKAASEAVMAKYVWNPYSKVQHLKAAAAVFEEAVKLDTENPEIRFLRFTVEHYIPRYLSMSENLEDDKRVIISSLKRYPASGLPQGLARTMRDFLLSKDHCNEKEQEQLRNITI